MKKRKGFTLAEVLITLTVIGAMAALTIPSLINNMNSAELKVLAKKAYSTVSQAYLMAVGDNGSGFYLSSTSSYTKFNAMKSKLNVIKECPYGSGSYGNCWASNGVGSATSPTNCARWGTSFQNANYAVATADGMYIMLYTYDSTTGADIVAIDVNGARGPNDWGKDVFTFTINDTFITPRESNCSGNLKHNDGSTVDPNEFTAPFIN